MSVLEKKFYIDYYDIGEDNKYLNIGFLKMMQQIASMHSKELGNGVEELKENNIGWVITNWKLKVISRPQENEKVTLRTWVRKINKLFFYRDFEVINEQGNCIAVAESKWIWMNLGDRSIVKIDEETRKKYAEIIEDKSVFEDNTFEKMEDLKNYENCIEYEIRRKDIDLNHHVNNLNYLSFANEAFTEDVYKMGELNNIEICYKKELKCGDKIECLYTKDEEGKKHVTIRNKETQEINAFLKYN